VTLLVAAALCTGALLLLAGINDWTLQETVQNVLKGEGNKPPTSPGASGQSGLGGNGQAGGGSGGGTGGSW
jgi:hypothetical protein